MAESRTEAGAELVIHVQEMLDHRGATAIRDRVLEATGTIVLDFRDARWLTPVDLSCLVRELSRECKARIVTRGLGRDHLRILQYLGVEMATFGVESEPPPRGD
jgi:hypothetical protein